MGIHQRLWNHYEIEQWHIPAEKSVDFPRRGLLTFAENSVICTVKAHADFPLKFIWTNGSQISLKVLVYTGICL